MRVIYMGLFLLTLTNAQQWNISLEKKDYEIHLKDVIKVPFIVNLVSSKDNSAPKITASTADAEIAIVSKPEFLESLNDNSTLWNGSINITGQHLGKTKITLSIDNVSVEILTVKVIRPERVIDKLFYISVAVLVSILYINFGCAMDWSVCRDTMRKPIGPLVGSFCQFIIMPLLSFGIGQIVFPKNPEMQIGMFFTGISPSGGASNIWTVLLGGNLPLSIGMTTLSTLASFGTMPLWIFTLGKYIMDKGNLTIPYRNVAMIAIGLIIPLTVGYFIQHKFPRFSRIMVRIMKPFSVILILFIVIFAIFTNIYLFEYFSWEIIVAGMGLPWLGFICGFMIMTICRQPQGDIRAIAIETGIQNTGIAIFLLQFSLEHPESDLTTVIPISCAIMTPIPLMILWLIRIVFNRSKKKNAASTEKLQSDVNTPVVTTPNVSTIAA